MLKKRSMFGLLAAGAIAVSLVQPVPAEDGQNPVMNFIGSYQAGRCSAQVEAVGNEGAQVTLMWVNSAFAATEWNMSGVFDPETMVLSYEDGTRIEHEADENGTDTTQVIYENGKGSFRFDENLTFTWDDQEEHAGDGLVFEWMPIVPETESEQAEEALTLSDDASDFVLLSEAVPDAILEIRYYSTYNFVGDRIDGYEEPVALLTKEAAEALKEVSDDLVQKGYRLKIYDAYRPQSAVTNFVNWAQDAEDTRMKEYFYPELEKDVLFPQGYISDHSGHSRGSTLDLTLFDMKTEKEVDMGGTFDYFGQLSHPDYTGITTEQYENRMLLREAMTSHGFNPLPEEWWHFTLADEPYPDTYFTFPVNSDSVVNE